MSYEVFIIGDAVYSVVVPLSSKSRSLKICIRLIRLCKYTTIKHPGRITVVYIYYR